MKRYIISALAAIAALSISCKKEEAVRTEGDTVTLCANLQDTKVSFAGVSGSQTLTKWDNTDKLWVRSSRQPSWERGESFNVKEVSADGKTAKFTGVIRTDGSIAAAYPYQMVSDAADNDAVVFDLASSYPSVEGSCPGETIAAAAFCKEGIKALNMDFVFGALKISLTGSGEKVVKLRVVDTRTDFCLWGRFTAVPDYETGKIKSISAENAEKYRYKSILVLQQTKTLSPTPTEFYFTVPEGAFAEGFVLRATLEDGTERQLSSMKANTVARGCVTCMPSTLLPTKVYNPDDPEVPEEPEEKKFSGGKGTEAEPYLIGKPADLVQLAQLCNNKTTNPDFHAAYYNIIGNIDMKDVAFSPICYDYDDDNGAFSGTLDGKDFTISNLVASPVDGSPCGLFGYIRGAKVKNLKIDGMKVNGMSKIGAVSGSSFGGSVIENCHVTGTELHSDLKDMIGGIIGTCYASTVKGCTVSGSKITSGDHNSIGGIVGFSKQDNVITDCTVSGCQISGYRFAGGILGRTVAGKVLNCTVTGKTTISTIERGAGGICGGDDGTSGDFTIDNCLFTGESSVKSKFYSGGIAGYIYPGESCNVSITNCGVEDALVLTQTEDAGDGTGDCCTGGIIGWLRNSNSKSTFKVVNCYCYVGEKGFEVDTKATKPSIGGIVGYISNSSTSSIVIAGCCTDFARTDLVVNGAVFKQGQDIVDSDRVGAIYGNNSHNNDITYKSNCWVNDTGFQAIGHSDKVSNVKFEDNLGYTTAVFQDGTTVVNKLNTFVAGETTLSLKNWTVRGNRPVLE